jgi:wyosine [tRNA(Phe)-imidazoG37] synthetase (radical SAM superfamily)
VYCQYGFTPDLRNTYFEFFSPHEVVEGLEREFTRCETQGIHVQHATLSGNGEPTMHPRFAEVVNALVEWRNRTRPGLKLALLTTGYRYREQSIRAAMELLDESIVKFDSAVPERWQEINRPLVPFSFDEFKENLRKFRNLTLQTMFIRGLNDGESEVNAWRKAIEEIRPRRVQIYTITRSPAQADLRPVEAAFLREVADACSSADTLVQVFLQDGL